MQEGPELPQVGALVELDAGIELFRRHVAGRADGAGPRSGAVVEDTGDREVDELDLLGSVAGGDDQDVLRRQVARCSTC